MKKLVVVAGIALVGLSTPAMSSPEKPTFLETAAFLITGERGEAYQLSEDGFNLVKNLPYTDNKQVIISNMSDQTNKCRVGHAIIEGKYSNNRSDFKVKEITLYDYHKLDGKRLVTSEYSEGLARHIPVEIMTGNKSVCKLFIENEKYWCEYPKDDMKFFLSSSENNDVLAERRQNAWKYLFSNFCEASKQPF